MFLLIMLGLEKVENEYRDYVKKIDTETMLTLYNTIQPTPSHYSLCQLKPLTIYIYRLRFFSQTCFSNIVK